MINILLVEDDVNKADKIRKAIRDVLLDTPFQIETATNAYDAGRCLREKGFDLLVLDVNLPMRAGEDPTPEAGANLLTSVSRRREFHIPAHVVGLTGFEDVFNEYRPLFSEFTWGLVRFQTGSDDWERQLKFKVEYIANSKVIDQNSGFETDIAIVTAMPHWELTKVLELDAGWRPHRIESDDTMYHLGEFGGRSRRLKVVAASAIQKGLPAATGLAMKMCIRFKPRYLAMTGIAAGVRGGFGDILVADKSWDYGSGKSIGEGASDGTAFGGARFEPAPTAIPLDAELIEKFRAFVSKRDVLRRIESEWRGERSATELGVQLGPIASGAAVLENRPLVEAIRGHDRKLIGVEMETYGVFLASRICPSPRPKAMSIKSICDLGDVAKGDAYQEYASYTSARYLFEFAVDQLG